MGNNASVVTHLHSPAAINILPYAIAVPLIHEVDAFPLLPIRSNSHAKPVTHAVNEVSFVELTGVLSIQNRVLAKAIHFATRIDLPTVFNGVVVHQYSEAEVGCVKFVTETMSVV
jgi:hypothetical protein